MGIDSRIEWTSSTYNPWRGCQKVSPGCDVCYMHREQIRWGHDPTKIVRCKTFYDPLKWKDGRMILTCSWSDFFIEEADCWREEVWNIISQTPRHTYQILTKRPHRIIDHLPSDWPLSNVWLGVTVENRRHGFPRIDILREIPASVRFLSAEPLIEDLGKINLKGIHWVIVGGESGPNARRMETDWARNIRDQCIQSGVRFFFKQFGEFDKHGKRVGKKRAGRLLDGKEWNEMPRNSIPLNEKFN